MVERAKGIEPSYEAWEASVLPLNYARNRNASDFYSEFAPHSTVSANVMAIWADALDRTAQCLPAKAAGDDRDISCRRSRAVPPNSLHDERGSEVLRTLGQVRILMVGNSSGN